MKAAFALLALLALASAAEDFTAWANRYHKSYTRQEFSRRMAIFKENVKRIEKLNKEGHATFAPTVFADLTQEEFASKFLGTVAPEEKYVTRTRLRNKIQNLPTNYDWREQEGVVGPVKDQASCGSCWAFSTVSYLEGQAVLKQSMPYTSLSEQQIVDCDSNCLDTPAPDGHPCDLGCNGGWPTTALEYIVANGSMSEKDYPYRGYNQDCKYDAKKVAVKFTGEPASLEVGDEASIKDLLYSEGPLSVSLDANPWSFYSSGIFSGSSCSSEWTAIDHSVLLVGWGHDESSGKDYWIVRNSWGPYWGEKGYIRLLMGKNTCGIANMVVWLKGQQY